MTSVLERDAVTSFADAMAKDEKTEEIRGKIALLGFDSHECDQIVEQLEQHVQVLGSDGRPIGEVPRIIRNGWHG